MNTDAQASGRDWLSISSTRGGSSTSAELPSSMSRDEQNDAAQDAKTEITLDGLSVLSNGRLAVSETPRVTVSGSSLTVAVPAPAEPPQSWA